MDAWLIALIFVLVIVAVIAIGAAVAFLSRSDRKRSQELRERFGPEYDRTVEEKGRQAGERDLAECEERVERLHIRELDPEERRRFSEEWHEVQARFVDEPSSAIGDADRLVQAVMDRRGYPVGDFEQRSADISVDHPDVVTNYREAHAIVMQHRESPVETERLRQAMIHYRALFDELLSEVPAR